MKACNRNFVVIMSLTAFLKWINYFHDSLGLTCNHSVITTAQLSYPTATFDSYLLSKYIKIFSDDDTFLDPLSTLM